MSAQHLPHTLLILGCGYVGTKLAKACQQRGITVKATARNPQHIANLQAHGIDALHEQDALQHNNWLHRCEAIVDSIPLAYHENRVPYQCQSDFIPKLLAKTPALTWVAYLSATSVYGDSLGAWINENTAAKPSSLRGKARLEAEQAWLMSGVPAEIFRLSGIYGNDRNILSKLFAGSYKTVAWQPAHYSNRIHVDDIVAALLAAMQQPQAGRIINMTDNYPCSHQEYVCRLAQHIGAAKPIVLNPQEAEQQLSPAFLDFFRDNKRISNQKLRKTLLPTLKYPSFVDAMDALKHEINAQTQGE